MADRDPMQMCRDVLSCKCGEERHDVQYGQLRLALVFVTINLVAASLGLNDLALAEKGDVDTTLGRGAFTATTTFEQFSVPGSNVTIEDAQVKVEYDFVDGDTCERVEVQLDKISEKDCEDIIVATNVWLAMGVLATFIFAFLFGLLLRVECRQLCSKPMRQVMLGICFLGFTFTFISWISIVASPVPEKFDTLGSSVWIMILASISSLACFVVSIIELRGAGGGPAPAAKSY